MGMQENKERNWEILKLRQEGKKLKEIAEIYGIAESRVCHIIARTKKRLLAKVSKDC